MDRVGLRKLVESGIARARDAWQALERAEDAEASAADTVLDRLVQAGQIALAYDQPWFLGEVMGGLLAIYRLALPSDRDAWQPDERSARWLHNVGSRAWILGAHAIRRERYDAVPQIALQHPVDKWMSTYWLRYTVTMAARGKLDVFQGKSLLGPISEMIRQRPQFFEAFDSNLDVAVNALCQFDLLACVLVVARTGQLDAVYPNFGGYYGERSSPIVHQIIHGGAARTTLGDTSDADLAEILYKLGQMTRKWFFDVNGWDGYSKEIRDYIKMHGGDEHGEE